jgi:predicted nucleic acid-binding protein
MAGVEPALAGVNRLFMDTAPVIYLAEQHSRYARLLGEIFARVDQGGLVAVTSPITLAERLVHPYRRGLTHLRDQFFDLVVNGPHTEFVPLDAAIADRAASLRAEHNLTLADALQLGTAMQSNCEGFLTNDLALERVAGIKVIVLERLIDV